MSQRHVTTTKESVNEVNDVTFFRLRCCDLRYDRASEGS